MLASQQQRVSTGSRNRSLTVAALKCSLSRARKRAERTPLVQVS